MSTLLPPPTTATGPPPDVSIAQIEAAMMAHAGGKQKPVSSPRRRQHISGGKKKSTAKDRRDLTAKKGFLLEAGSSGALYGIEGSREGGGGTRPRQKLDPEFQRLVAMADPELGDEASLGAFSSQHHCVPCVTGRFLL